jgi:catechol-2,3-dioxygenase
MHHSVRIRTFDAHRDLRALATAASRRRSRRSRRDVVYYNDPSGNVVAVTIRRRKRSAWSVTRRVQKSIVCFDPEQAYRPHKSGASFATSAATFPAITA